MKRIDFEKLFGRFAIILLVTLLLFIIVDRISIRFLDPRSPAEKQYKVYVVRHPKPYVVFGGLPFGKIWDVTLNELGYRGEVPKIPKPPGEFRIIMLGGSSVFMGNPPIPRLVQYQFEKKGCKNVKVYNFGVVSSVTGMELARILFEVINYKPDLIISYSGFNDIYQPFVADPRPGYPHNYIINEYNPLLESNIKTYPTLALLAYGSNLMRYFFPKYFESAFIELKRIRKEVKHGTKAWREEIAQTYIDNIVKSHMISKAFGIDFITFFQPSLYFKKNVSPGEIKLINPIHRNNAILVKKIIDERMEEARENYGLFYVDLSDPFPDAPETAYIDGVHLKQFYRPVIAEEIHKYLLYYFRGHQEILLKKNNACTN